MEPRLNTCFLRPTRSTTQTASRSVEPLLQGSLLWQTNRLTDRLTDRDIRSVTIGRIYVCSSAVRPNNSWKTKPKCTQKYVNLTIFRHLGLLQ